ncbi:hypothetical protein HPB51_010443 [Rhipicephalus microplus]|uniref:CCHC-type domain-containing protein n=1 Tax=Rhipicephalus microplus TaxID=6941 RepID=A0A9J6ESW0_RHIMP|nr:hypothetical protein HPB51_010443 [Rhipicephalus microplus]
MASVAANIAADEKHSSPSHSTDHMMDTQTSQDADTQASSEHNAHPWITINKRTKCRQLQPRTIPTQQLPSTPSEPILRQSRPKTRQPRLPPLPEDYNLAIGPHGVVNKIGHEIAPDFLTEVEVPGYEVLTCRRLGDSEAMVLTFRGKRVPFFVNTYGQALCCYLYKLTTPHCRKCNKTGHREDVCPKPPDTLKCRVCGDSLSPNNHECRPSCMLCGGDHPTAAKPYPKQFLPPVNRRKPHRSATLTRKAQSPSPSPVRQSSASGSAARRRSRSRNKSGP